MSPVIDQRWQMELVGLHQLRIALELEMKTGMRRSSRGPATSKIAQQVLLDRGIRCTTNKAKLVEALEKLIAEKEKEHGITPRTEA